jgi:hypothetical protein
MSAQIKITKRTQALEPGPSLKPRNIIIFPFPPNTFPAQKRTHQLNRHA